MTAISDCGVSKAISRLTGKMLGSSANRQDLLQYIHDL